MNCCLSADFGGTEIKTRILSETGEFLSPVRHFPANAKADEHTLLSHIRTVLETAIADAPAPLSRAGLAFPGPFDYENGIPLMQGINKYDALYGKNLRAFLEQAFPAVSFRFANDADLFGLGEYHFCGEPREERVMYICIGTGLGSCFIENGALIKNRADVPPCGWIFAEPFDDDIIDRMVSGSALVRMMREVPELYNLSDVRAAADAAFSGNAAAFRLFGCFGGRLIRAVIPFLERFGAQRLVVGGQIVKSFSLFGNELESACFARGIALSLCPTSADYAMKGALRLF